MASFAQRAGGILQQRKSAAISVGIVAVGTELV
jgi:hypothetical protein